MIRLFRRLRARLRYRHFTVDLQREIDVHRAMAEDDLRARGETPDDATRVVSRRLGNVTLARESSRAVWIAPWLEGVWLDVRYALRGLWARPSFTLPVLAVLVVTMGLTTGLFVAAESLLFRPWPVADAERVVGVSTLQQVRGATFFSVGGPEYRYLREHARSVDLIAMGTMRLKLGPAPQAESAVRLVSGNYFSALRIPVAAGRGLTPADDDPGGPAVAVVSQGLWRREFGGTVDALGSTLLIGGVPFTVVGIANAGAGDDPAAMPPEAWLAVQARALLPPGGEPSARALLEAPRGSGLQLAGRLVDGADKGQAEAELRTLAAQYARAHGLPLLGISVTGTAFAEQPSSARAVRLFSLLALATGLVLLLGCANVGNLQIARGVSRRDEFALRLALGAPRARLVRQLLVEGLVLAVVAAGLSVIVAAHVPQWLVGAQGDPATASRFAERVTIDGASILFASGLAVAVCLVAGLLPALRTTGVTVRSRVAGPDRARLRSGLLAFQLAISGVLLVGTGLLVRSVNHAAGDGLGFDPYGVAVVSVGLPVDDYESAAGEQFSRRLADAIAQRGDAMAATRFTPFGAHTASYDVGVPGDERSHRAVTHWVTPGYFDILQVPVIDGRVFGADASVDEVVVNASLAQLLWPDQTAVGRVFLDGTLEKRVIGVVGDARTENVGFASPTYYQGFGPYVALIVPDDRAAITNAKDLIRQLEPRAVPVLLDHAAGLRQQLGPSIAGAATAAALGLLALFLASVGTFGVFSYLVNERVREIGVRVALGAGSADLVRLLVRRMCWPIGAGLVMGIAAAAVLAPAIAGSLHGFSATDPVAYILAVSVLATSAVVAAAVPTCRAFRVDPAVTLRHE
jgi:putative ABC transport system permease protein